MPRRGNTANLKPFQKGQSGNPGGRPKGLASLVREKTSDGVELVEFHLSILRSAGQATADRLKAAQWLADRGFGKAVEEVNLTAENRNETTIRYVNDWRQVAAEELPPES